MNKLLLKRGTLENLERVNPVLDLGEPLFVIDENKLKIGDGVTPFVSLPYICCISGGKVIERIIERVGGGGMSKSAVIGLIQEYGGTTPTPPTPTPLEITSFTGGGVYEIGTIVNPVNLAWTYNYDPDTSQSIDQGIGSLPLLDRTYSFTTPISSNTTFTLSATDSVRGSDSDTESLSFLNRRYWGVTTSATMTSADVTGGSSELVESISKDIAFNCTGGRYFFYAFPIRLGSLSTINTKVNGLTYSDWSDNGGGSTVSGFTLSITNSSGYTETYRVYRSFNLQNGAYIPTEMR